MEDHGLTFEDLSKMTRSQKRFLYVTKAERISDEHEELKKIEQERKKSSPKRSRKPLRRPR